MLTNKYISFGSNNIAKFIDYQILADTLIKQLKQIEDISVILSIDILLMVTESSTFDWHLARVTI